MHSAKADDGEGSQSYINIEIKIYLDGHSTWIGCLFGFGILLVCQRAIELAKHGEDDRNESTAVSEAEEPEEAEEVADIRVSLALEILRADCYLL